MRKAKFSSDIQYVQTVRWTAEATTKYFNPSIWTPAVQKKEPEPLIWRGSITLTSDKHKKNVSPTRRHRLILSQTQNNPHQKKSCILCHYFLWFWVFIKVATIHQSLSFWESQLWSGKILSFLFCYSWVGHDVAAEFRGLKKEQLLSESRCRQTEQHHRLSVALLYRVKDTFLKKKGVLWIITNTIIN